MIFNDILRDSKLLTQISDKEILEQLYQDGKEQYKPIADTLHLIFLRQQEIEEQEYLNNRGIKKYKILKELETQLSEDFNEVLIDLDEYLSCIPLRNYFSTGRLHDILKERNVYNKKNFETIINFLINKQIISAKYEYLCERCNERILTLDFHPTEEQLEELLSNCGKTCNNCCEELSSSLECIEKSLLYNLLIRKQ